MNPESGAPAMDPAPTAPPPQGRWLARARRMVYNPVLVKELRGRMRNSRAFIVITVYLALLSLALLTVYLLFVSTSSGALGAQRQEFGKTLFGVVFFLELLTVCFVAPALTADAIAGEKERQTYDILRVTLLPASDLVWGKFAAGLVYILLMTLVALPLLALPFIIGGITFREVFIGALLLGVTAMSFCAVGIYLSSRLRSTLLATVLSYAFALLQVFGVPALLLAGLFVFSSGLGGMRQPAPATELILVVVGWILISVNPLAAALVSELILLNENQLWFYRFELTETSVLLPLPWLPYLLFYLLVTALFLWRSVKVVRHGKS